MDLLSKRKRKINNTHLANEISTEFEVSSVQRDTVIDYVGITIDTTSKQYIEVSIYKVILSHLRS